jgi:hypothetical protein
MKTLLTIAIMTATLSFISAPATFADDAIKTSACAGHLTPRGIFDCR